MKYIYLIVTLVLSGCVHTTYNSDGTSEDFSLWSLFKSVDGLYAERSAESFSIGMDATHTQDPIGSMTDMLRELNRLKQIEVIEEDE